jgi:NitT/TauT family transport system substrate-binding protein
MINIQRLRGIAISAALVAAGLASSTTVRADEKVVANGETVRIQEYTGTILHFTQWVAADKGFCEAHGIKCVMVKIPSGPLGLQALVAGSLDISFASTEVTMQAAARGNDVQLIVGHSPNNIYTLDVKKGVPLPHLKEGYPAVVQDLKGLKVGVTARGSGVELQTRALLSGAGLSPDAVTYVAVGGPGTAYGSFISGQIDAAMMFEPFRAICHVQDTCVDLLDFAKGEGPAEISALNGAFETYAARRNYIEEHPVVIDAFIQAMTEATAWVRDPANYDELLKIVKSRFQLGAEIADHDKVIAELVRTGAPLYGVGINRNSVKAFSDYLLNAGLIPGPVDPASFVYSKAPKP